MTVVSPGPGDGGWGVEKKLRIEFVVGTLLTIAGFVWYASGQDQVILQQGKALTRLEVIASETAVARYALNDRITKLETKQESVAETVKRIEAVVNQINEKRR